MRVHVVHVDTTAQPFIVTIQTAGIQLLHNYYWTTCTCVHHLSLANSISDYVYSI